MNVNHLHSIAYHWNKNNHTSQVITKILFSSPLNKQCKVSFFIIMVSLASAWFVEPYCKGLFHIGSTDTEATLQLESGLSASWIQLKHHEQNLHIMVVFLYNVIIQAQFQSSSNTCPSTLDPTVFTPKCYVTSETCTLIAPCHSPSHVESSLCNAINDCQTRHISDTIMFLFISTLMGEASVLEQPWGAFCKKCMSSLLKPLENFMCYHLFLKV